MSEPRYHAEGKVVVHPEGLRINAESYPGAVALAASHNALLVRAEAAESACDAALAQLERVRESLALARSALYDTRNRRGLRDHAITALNTSINALAAPLPGALRERDALLRECRDYIEMHGGLAARKHAQGLVARIDAALAGDR